MSDISSLIILAVVLAISISLHEYAHAWASHRLWDPTPKLQGRLTPNPLAHIDPVGFILIFLIHFGWWKPVQINPWYYKNPVRDEFLVAMAWPASNIIMALLGVLFLKIYTWDLILLSSQTNLFTIFWWQFIFLNVWLALFNLLPIPPLDGRKLVKLFIGNATLRLEHILATNPLLLIILFVLLWRSWFFWFLWDWANTAVNKLMRMINLLR